MNVNGKKLCISCMRPLEKTGECMHCGFNQSEYKQIPCCLSPGTLLSKRYVVGKVIGEGSFGITYIGWDTLLECVVAVKEYFPFDLATRDVINASNDVHLFLNDNEEEYKEKLEKFLKEARCLTKFNQLSGVVSVKDFFYENETAYIVMEYVSGCSVKDFIQKNGRMDGKEVISLMKPVLNSLDEIHKSGIVHRDISPDNLLLSEKGELVLIDFGSSRIRDIDMMKSMTVTFKRGFSPEEQYRSRGMQGAWTDVYSVCATIYYMLTGEIPIESVERVVGGRLQSLVEMTDINISVKQKKAIMKGLSIDAKERYQSISQLYADLYTAEESIIVKKKNPKRLYAGLILGVAIVVLGLMLLNNKNDDVKPAVPTQPVVTKMPAVANVTESPTKVPTAAPTATPTLSPKVYVMVSVVGMSEKEAKTKIKEIGSQTLKIKIKKTYDSSVSKGIVIKQSMKKGESFREDENKTIILYVSKGKQKTTEPNNLDIHGQISDKNDDVVGTIP